MGTMNRFVWLAIATGLYVILAEATAYGCVNHGQVNAWLWVNIQCLLIFGGFGLVIGWFIAFLKYYG